MSSVTLNSTIIGFPDLIIGARIKPSADAIDGYLFYVTTDGNGNKIVGITAPIGSGDVLENENGVAFTKDAAGTPHLEDSPWCTFDPIADGFKVLATDASFFQVQTFPLTVTLQVKDNNVGMDLNSENNNCLNVYVSGPGGVGLFVNMGDDTATSAMQAFRGFGSVWINNFDQTALRAFDESFIQRFMLTLKGRMFLPIGEPPAIENIDWGMPVLTNSQDGVTTETGTPNVAASDPTEVYTYTSGVGNLNVTGDELQLNAALTLANNADNKRVYVKLNGLTIWDTGNLALIGGMINLRLNVVRIDDTKVRWVYHHIADLEAIPQSGTNVETVNDLTANTLTISLEIAGDADDDIVLVYARTTALSGLVSIPTL